MKSTNPVLRSDAFKVLSTEKVHEGTMTVKGTAIKTLLLLMCTVASSAWIWQEFFTHQNFNKITAYVIGGVVGGFICTIVTIFKKEWSKVTSIAYAIFEGFAIGGISSFLESKYPGIAIQASALTFGTLGIMLVLYINRIIPVTERLKTGIVAATGAIALFYFVSMILSFFGINMGFIHGSGPISIGFSLIVVGIAAFNLLLDFDLIEEGSKQGAPKYMEWYAAFGLIVTLIWLYLEIIRLLAKLRENRR